MFVCYSISFIVCISVFGLLRTARSQTFRPEDMGNCTPDGVTLCTSAIRAAVARCRAQNGCLLLFEGPGAYLTQAFNITSNMQIRLGVNATILGTSEDRYNIHGDWPILPWAQYPSPPTYDPNPVYQAVVRGYNVSNVSIVADRAGHLAGTLDCGGTYWICAANKASSSFCKAPFCSHPPCNASAIYTLARPRCLHLVESSNIRIFNLTMRNSPFWNLHFDLSKEILVDGLHVYQYPDGANADGIDIDSSSHAVIRNSMIDSNDDALCVKSGANWLGRHNGKTSENIIFENIEIRAGHGLTLGSEMSGGIHNVTFRNIYLNPAASDVNADPRNPGRDKGCLSRRTFCPGGAHFKTSRGRGGFIENILYDNITGYGAGSAIGFGEDYGHSVPPSTNSTATPRIRNVTVRNMHLTHVVGDEFSAPPPYRALACAHVETLAESPIQGMYLENVFIQGKCGQNFRCSSFVGNSTSGSRGRLYAFGHARNVSINGKGIDSPNDCAFMGMRDLLFV